MNDETTPESIRGFCVLEYIAREDRRAAGGEPIIIAFVILSEDNQAGIRVHPDWEKIVQAHDIEYLESLYRDFKDRIKSDPDALFRQLWNLAVGPLVTRYSGSDPSESRAYRSLISWFRKL